jgi:hypothetical protein
MLSQVEVEQLRGQLLDLRTRVKQLDASIGMEQIILHSILSSFPDDQSIAKHAGASTATASKAQIRDRIAQWDFERRNLSDRILEIEYQLPVSVAPRPPLQLVKNPKKG